MHAQRSGNEIGCVGQDVPIFSDARDFAFLFKSAISILSNGRYFGS